MCLIVEIAMTILGIFALIKGEVKLTRKKSVRGWPAYVIGALMVATLPLAVMAGVVIAVAIVVSGEQVNMARHGVLLTGGDVGVVIGIALISTILSVVFAKDPLSPPSPVFPPFSHQNVSLPQAPSPPMDPNNPYAPPPDTGPNYPYQKYRRYAGRS